MGVVVQRRGECIALLCLCVACWCDHTVAPATYAAEQTVEISVRARGGDEWSSLQPDGLLSLRVEAPAAGELAADLDAFLSLPEVQSDADAAAAGPGAGAPQVTVAVDAVDVASCRLPCSVRLENVAWGEHVVTAAGTGTWRGLAARPCRFWLSRLDEAEAGGLGEAKGATDSNFAAHGLEPGLAVPQHGQAVEPSAGPEDTSLRADGGGRREHQPEFDADGRYVAILFPPDDTCLTDGRSAYVSVSVTDGFFKLPRTHDILARFETTVHCIIGDNDMVLPAPLDYDPKTQGPLVQCHSYESDFTLTDGYVRKLDGSLAGTPGMGQHDCPPGTICKHDLEDGFMIDVWLVVPESGQTIQSDLAAGMHVSRFFLIDAHSREQMGREATVTFFVDHGTGRVCRPPSFTSVLNRHPPRERDAGSKSDSKIPATQPKPRKKRRRLQNVARRGRAVQSSTVDGADAGLAIDGSTAIGGVPGDQSAPGSGRPTGRSSRTMHEPSPFWEVELEAPVQLESMTVWADLRSTGPRGYPAFEVATPLAPVRIFLLDADRDVLAERVFDEEGYGNAELLTWEDIQREVVGARVQAVRLQLEFMGSTGETEHSSDLRQLAVREVQLWAWEAWDGKGRGGEGEGGGCITDADCVYGWCRGSTIGGEEGAEGGGDGGAGSATQAVCVCDPNWFGSHCDSSILHSAQFLPPLLSDQEFLESGEDEAEWVVGEGDAMRGDKQRQGCVYEGCQTDDPLVEAALLDRTILDLEVIQGIDPEGMRRRGGAGGRVRDCRGKEDGCSSENTISFFFENRGLAATLLHIAGLLGFAFLQRRSLVLSRTHAWVYTDEATCPQRDLQCYFLPWSKCQTRGNGTVSEGSFLAGGRDNLVRDFNWAVPPELQHKGVFWWRLACVSVLWRVRGDILDELAVDQVKRKIGFQHPIIAMHVRRGDSCYTSLRRNRCRSLIDNLRGVEAMAKRYKTRRVFLATDSPSVKGELEALAPQLNFVSISSFDRSSLERSIHHCAQKHPGKTDDGLTLEDGCTGNDAWLEHRLGRGYVKQRELALATILDLILMSHADYFVGHFASNLSRLAYLLAVRHHRRMIPYWSVDGPWCYHWRMCCDIGVDGSSAVC